MNVRATAKFVRTSPRKVGLVAQLIRGRKVSEAQTILITTGKRATDPIGKVLNSAVANAENNFNLKARNLVVESVLVGPGPTLKRFRPRAQGRASAILKRTSHITVVLSDATDAVEAVPKSTPKATPAKKEAK
jgi:large subunit ribosomal protein L22